MYPKTKAIAHYERTGCIPLGYSGEIAAYLAEQDSQENNPDA